MNLAGIAAALALVSIPVNALVARWQIRSTLQQAEMNQRGAMALTRTQVEAERRRLQMETRETENRIYAPKRVELDKAMAAALQRRWA
ncbi:hypothetical protein [Streptomyces sp. R41]|uniref:Uncharacterized protein n=1 Tax=Streptomyces sp. R41 TaxID=3238632 RepID=A0AB39R7I9_9ACTN